MDDFSAKERSVLVGQRVVVGGGEIPLSSASSSRMGFSAELPISKSSNAVGEKGVSMPGLKTASITS